MTPLCNSANGWCGHVPDCPRCKLRATVPGAAAIIDRQDGVTRVKPLTARRGVGTHLKLLLASLGLGESAGCGCESWRAKMDTWGPGGCRKNRAAIEAHLRDEARKVGWLATLKAGAAAVSQGLLLNPLNPAPGLLDEAIRRAEADRLPPTLPPAPRNTLGAPLVIPTPPALDLRPTSPRALVTVVVGTEAERLFAAAGPHMRRYAEAHGADFHVSTWPGAAAWPMSAKYGVARYLDHYEQVVYVDADVLLRPGAVDLFALVPAGGFGAMNELPFHRAQGDRIEADFAAWRTAAGFPAGSIDRYFNCGVQVVWRAARHLIEPPAELWVAHKGQNRHCAEQHYTNSLLLMTSVPVTELPRDANWQNWTDHEFKEAGPAAVLHLSGGDAAGRKRRARDLAKLAAASPWPVRPSTFTPPPELYANPKHHYYADPTHVGMLHAELASGRYGRVLEVGCFHGYSSAAFLRAYRDDQIGEVHLCDTAVTAELRRVIDHYAAGDVRKQLYVHEERSVGLLARDAHFDFAFLDGDHGEEAVREEVRLLVAAGCRTIAAHDVSPAAAERYGVAGGPALVRGLLEAAGYTCRVDDAPRPGERTERGLLIGTRGVTPPVAGERLSIVIPTTGRPTIGRTLASITPQLLPGDDVHVIRDATGDVGATPRTRGMDEATGDYLLFMDDDDVYTDGALDVVRAAVRADPGRVHLFRLTSGVGWTLGIEPVVRVGNVGTQMVVVPNDKAKLGEWGRRRVGDFDFIRSTLQHYPEGPLWHPQVIACWRPAGGAP